VRGAGGAAAPPALPVVLIEDSPSATPESSIVISIVILCKTIMGAGGCWPGLAGWLADWLAGSWGLLQAGLAGGESSKCSGCEEERC